MADSEALRARRARKHKGGDHSLCRRCPAVRGEGAPPGNVTSLPQQPPPSGPSFDPDAEMRDLAARLAEYHRACPSDSMAARELRLTLAELTPKGNAADADLTGLFGALQA